MKKEENNYCFIDGQNLYRGLKWKMDYKKFRIYLKDKYNISKAYYFLGFKEKENSLYEKLQEAGFILVFNIKGENLKSNKKGNIDTNLVFYMMKKYIEDDFSKAILVSGDGDFKMVVDYFLEKNKFKKILLPNIKFASALYRKDKTLAESYLVRLDDLRKKLEK